MRVEAGPGRRAGAAATAVAGVVGAHALGYLAVFPAPAERHGHLAATGHGYWPVAVVAALAAGGAAVGAAAARGAAAGLASRRPPSPSRSPSRSPSPSPTSVARAVAGLAAWQVLAFTAVETAERAVAHVSPAVLARSPEFGAGLALQVLVAAATVVLLGGLERAARAVAAEVARRGRGRPRPTPPVVPAPAPHSHRPAPSRSPSVPRAPPVAVPA
jgi:hypothetical protein